MISFIYFLAFNAIALLVLPGCASQKNSEVRQVIASKEYSKPYSTPINKDISQSYTHLRSYEGHLLLGNDFIQLILAGIPGSPSKDMVQPFLLDVFIKKNARWSRYSKNFPNWISFSDPQKEKMTWFPIGFELKNKNEYSSIQYTWANLKNSRKLKTELGLKPDKAIASFLMQQKNSYKEQAIFHFNGQLNFNTSLPFDQTKILTFQNSNEIFSLISANKIILNKQAKEITARSISNKNRLHFLFGETILLSTPSLISQLESCEIETDLSAVYKCLDKQDSNNSRTKIDIINRVENEDDFLYPYWLKNISNQETYYIPIRSISENVLSLNKNFSYQLYNIASNENKQYKIAKDTTNIEISLPATKTTSISLSSKETAFLSIESKYPKGQFSFIKGNIPKDTTYISNSIIMVKKWPINIKLPENDYIVKIFNDNYTYCIEDLSAQSSDNISCKTSSELPKLNSSFWPISNTIFAQNDNQYKTINLSSNFPFTVRDEGTPFAIRVNTNNQKAEALWKNYYKKKKLSKLPLIKKFVSEQLKTASLTLTCPDYHFDLEAYKWLINTIKPDFAEAFNCTTEFQETKIRSHIHKWQRKKDIKIVPSNKRSLSKFYSQIKTKLKENPPIDYISFTKEPYSFYTSTYMGLNGETKIVGNKIQMTVDLSNLSNSAENYRVLAYSTEDVIRQRAFKLKAGESKSMLFNFKITEETNWIRFELYNGDNVVAIIPPFKSY